MLRNFIITLFFITITSCNLQPNYEKPETAVPLQEAQQEINHISWQRFFANSELQDIITLALENNQDLKIAQLNIDESQATYNISKTNFLPSLSATAARTEQGAPAAFAAFTPQTIYRANLSIASYELDFFGRLRNVKESALQDFLSTKESRNIAQISLIAQIVSSYTQYLANKELSEISQIKMTIWQEKYALATSRYKHGMIAKTDLNVVQDALENEKTNYETYLQNLENDKNNLMILSGVFSADKLPLNNTLANVKINEELLEFTPSTTLLSRPDVKKAEHVLRAANADIGAARAAFFPSISLTGNYGYSSRKLTDLFDSKSWSYTPQINLPIFTGGRNLTNLKISNIRKKIEIANYEKAIQTAFKEALDELNNRKAIKQRLESSVTILTNKFDSLNIEESKYKAGISGLENSLNAKLELLTAKQNHVLNQQQYLTNLASLYKALGGGSDVVVEEK